MTDTVRDEILGMRERHDLDTPLLVRRSRRQVVAGLIFGIVGVAAITAFARGSMQIPALLMGLVFLAVCLVLTVIELVDRRPRLILEREKLQWLPALGPMAWTAWPNIRSARISDTPYHSSTCWLELTLVSASGREREISVKLDRLTLDGDEVLEAIRVRAPHLRPTIGGEHDRPRP